MEILYTVDEKYLQAIEELNFGELPKALHLFNDILNIDPDYARAHYQLGLCYFYQFKNYQTAGYHFKKCIDLDPDFPDGYIDYLKLLITLKMHKAIPHIMEKALQVPGIRMIEIYELMGKYSEQKQDFLAAKRQYDKGSLVSTNQTEFENFQVHVKRILSKQEANPTMRYTYTEG